MNLTTIILTKNNQDSITNCLKSVSFSKELILLDDNSTDQTILKAKKFNCKIFSHPLNNDWAAQRNFALSKASSDWVLFLDSDEIVSNDLKKEILSAINEEVDGYHIYRQDLFLGKHLNYGETSNVKLLRLARINSGHWKGKVHEVWQVNGRKKTLKNPILHTRDINLTDFLTRIDRYSSLASHDKLHYSDLLKPILKFFYNYIYLLGFLDGFQGLVMAYFMSMHSIAVRIKSWEERNK